MTKRSQILMDCIVVGGCANGALLPKIRGDADWIELRRPEYIRPVADVSQEMPDIHHESDVYEVHPLSLANSGDKKAALFGIAVVEGKTLTWAFGQLVTAHVTQTTERLRAANLLKTN